MAALTKIAAKKSMGFWALGQQPIVSRADAPVMPKPRYEIMRKYLPGARALDMMHRTGSVQVTVDFFDELNLVNKIRTAARASPFLAALVSASPFTEGKPNGFKSVRYQVWLETDDERCGIWPEMLDEEGLRVTRYLARCLKTPAMFFKRGGKYLAVEPRLFETYIDEGVVGTDVTVSDLLDHLTTFFPEIRPKGYVEMRGADCVTVNEAVAIAGFWRGILDDESTRQQVDERLGVLDYAQLRTLQPQIAKLGLQASSPIGPVAEIAHWLVELAYNRLANGSPDCAECLLPLMERSTAQRSPADDMLQIAAEKGVQAALELVRI